MIARVPGIDCHAPPRPAETVSSCRTCSGTGTPTHPLHPDCTCTRRSFLHPTYDCMSTRLEVLQAAAQAHSRRRSLPHVHRSAWLHGPHGRARSQGMREQAAVVTEGGLTVDSPICMRISLHGHAHTSLYATV